MNIEELRSYALQKEHAEESFPFGEETLVFKVDNKIFMLMGLDQPELSMNVKVDPGKAIELREEYPGNIFPGYHMNKKHWNTITVDGSIATGLLKELIDHSYDLVRPKKK